MLPQVDVEDPAAVAAFVGATYRALYPAADPAPLRDLFRDVAALFGGRTPGYAAIDLKYHDLRHTLMVAVCMALLLEGRHAAGGGELNPREFELAMAAVLLHDAGYLKAVTDTAGTGAKYTATHIPRSCAFAAAYLAGRGATPAEIEGVVAAIHCTGPNAEIGRLRFRDPSSRITGCALATADYLAQLADPRYPDKLGELYAEFRESDDHAQVPADRRAFQSEEDLVRRTPGFWAHVVKPKLEGDFQSVYRLLERPLHSGRNAYIAAAEENMAAISRRIEAIRPAEA